MRLFLLSCGTQSCLIKYVNLNRYEHMLEAWVSVLHESTNSFPEEFISKSAIQVMKVN